MNTFFSKFNLDASDAGFFPPLTLEILLINTLQSSTHIYFGHFYANECLILLLYGLRSQLSIMQKPWSFTQFNNSRTVAPLISGSSSQHILLSVTVSIVYEKYWGGTYHYPTIPLSKAYLLIIRFTSCLSFWLMFKVLLQSRELSSGERLLDAWSDPTHYVVPYERG